VSGTPTEPRPRATGHLCDAVPAGAGPLVPVMQTRAPCRSASRTVHVPPTRRRIPRLAVYCAQQSSRVSPYPTCSRCGHAAPVPSEQTYESAPAAAALVRGSPERLFVDLDLTGAAGAPCHALPPCAVRLSRDEAGPLAGRAPPRTRPYARADHRHADSPRARTQMTMRTGPDLRCVLCVSPQHLTCTKARAPYPARPCEVQAQLVVRRRAPGRSVQHESAVRLLASNTPRSSDPSRAGSKTSHAWERSQRSQARMR
jgi:hypothetical protein